MASKVTRLYTGLAGLPASANPRKDLIQNYGRLIRMLAKLPDESKYKAPTMALIKGRKEIVETTENPEDIEKKIGCGTCEELVEHAKLEMTLVEKMQEYKPWEPLVEKPEPNQWKWPV